MSLSVVRLFLILLRCCLVFMLFMINRKLVFSLVFMLVFFVVKFVSGIYFLLLFLEILWVLIVMGRCVLLGIFGKMSF